MAGQALYRKWRSQTFAELVGQEHVVQTLRNAIRTDRIGHAYLFTGPRGVGKTTMARLLAKAVNCLAPVEQRPCDECSECRMIAEGRAVDVIEMDAASHTGVDDAREIIERVQFRPTSARTKVYIIDEVHMLSTAAFNALLKTLEEPPPHVLFILATTEFHKVPATIISRCQRFVFSRHSVSDIIGHVEQIAEAEGIALESGVAEHIARSATGARRDALSILDQLMAGTDDTVTLAQVQGLLGAAESGEVGALVRALIDADVEGGLRTINEVADNGADLRQFARDVVDRLRALMVVAATNDVSTLDLPDETVDEVREQAAQAPVGQVVQWLKLFANLDQQLKNSPYGQLPLEIALVEALTVPATVPVARPAAVSAPQRPNTQPRPQPAQPPVSTATTAGAAPAAARPAAQPPTQPAQPPTSTANATGAAQAAARPATQPAAQPVQPAPSTATAAGATQAAARPATQPAAQASEEGPQGGQVVEPALVIEVEDNAVFTLEEVEQLWPQFREDMRAESPLIYAQMEGLTPINIEDNVVVALAKGSWQQQKLETEKTRRLLEKTLSKLLRMTAKIRFTIDQREEMPDERKMIQHVRNDPLIRKALNIFEAEIIGIDTP